MSALVALPDLKIRLGIPVSTTTFDDALNALISQVSALVEGHCLAPLSQATYTDYLDGTGTNWLPLPRRFVQSVSSVSVDDATGNYGSTAGGFATPLVSGTDYALVRGMLYRINGVWTRPRVRRAGDLSVMTPTPLSGNGNVCVTYVAGFSPIPADLQLAVLDVIALARTAGQRGQTLQSESFDGYSYSLGALNTTAAWMGYLAGPGGAILNRYRRIPV